MKRIALLLIALFAITSANAQRKTDVLDRGLVAVPVGSAGNSKWNFISWRKLANESYDVTYNLYKDGTLLASNLTNTSYYDGTNAYTTTSYQVAAVVKGTVQSKCTAVTPWNQYIYTNAYRTGNGYIDLVMSDVYDRNGNLIAASHYSPNDAEFADLDGDGQLEMIIKRINDYDASGSWDGVSKDIYAESSVEFDIFDAYDINWQTGATTLMWRIDCGPNMASLNHTETNIIAFDWDEDGKAEVVLRGADNMLIWNGSLTSYTTIGSNSVNTRNAITSHSNAQYAWTHTGSEYLIYLNGETGALYSSVTYPLKRLESGESSENSAWGDGYGHRSTKHFLGAPSFDGRTHSLFLARGIYTRHKMIAMDLNKSSHTWSTRWTWSNNTSGSIWYGQGNHNYVVADVDQDGRDEIIYGSMAIDDNGKGLSSTGLGHGDAMHVSDMNPYRPGLEVFACNETSPNNNYRDAITSEIFYRSVGSSDDGRALMANLSNTYPGSMGRSVGSGMVSSVTNDLMNLSSDGDSYINYGDLNFRIYWDGDLCSEILNSPGTAREAKIEKPEVGRLFTSSGCAMNNDSKNNPCFQGDLIGDWREEIAVKCGTNVRIYTSGISTDYNMPCLWFDHQYRQAMVWQMMAYNQPPHLSYFVGELEGFTASPPPYTMEDRTEISNGGTIGTAYDNQQIIMAQTNDMTVSVTNGASPWVFIDNSPTWTQGNNGSAITTTTYTHTLTGGGFGGSMNLVKQGKGTLVLPNATESYTGKTDIWDGTLQFDGTMSSSPVWMNRHTTLISNGGTFNGGIESLYGSTIIPGGEDNQGDITTTTLTLNYGSRLKIDVYASGMTADNINIGTLNINTKSGDTWDKYGPEYLAPVIEFVTHGTLTNGLYLLGSMETIVGSLNDIVIEGLSGIPAYELIHNNGNWYLNVNFEQDPASTVGGYNITNAMAPYLSTASTSEWDNSGFSVNTGAGWEDTNGDARTTWPFIERWVASGSLPDSHITQTINELPNGTYYIGGSFIASNQFDASATVTGVTFQAQNKSLDISTADHTPERYSIKVDVTDGTLTYGVNVSSTNANWVAMDNFYLIYDGTEEEYYANATASNPVRVVLTNPRMEDGNTGWTLASRGNGYWKSNTTSYTNFTGTFMETWTQDTGALGNKSAMQTVSLIDGCYKLKAAVNATRQNDATLEVSGVTLNFGDQSVSCHTANGVPEIFSIQTILEEEDDYEIGLKIEGTEANWVAWDNLILYYYGKQDPGTFANGYDITNAMAPYLSTASLGEWTNNGFSVNTGAGWEDTNGDAKTTWPFIEKYVGSGSLPTSSLSQTIKELPNGTYYIGGSFIASNQFDASATVTGVTFVAQDKSATISTANHVPERYSLKVDVTDGTLTYGLNVSGTNANWVAMDNFYLIYDGTEEEYYANATTENPVRVVLSNPRMEDSLTAWTTTSTGNGTWQLMTATYTNFSGSFMEAWTDASGTLGNKTATQTLSLREGEYLLKAAVNATRQNNTSLSVSGVNLILGDESVSCHTGNGVPEVYSISANLTEDNYDIGLTVSSTDANWIAWDNLILYYYGNSLNLYQRALKLCQDAAAVKESSTPGAARSALNEYEWTTSEYSTKTQAEIDDAIAALTNGNSISRASQDASVLLTNASFPTTRINTQPAGWTFDSSYSNGGDIWTEGGVFNAWSPSITYLDMYQSLDNLPRGTYKITAECGTDITDGTSKVGVYAKSGTNNARSEEVTTLNTYETRNYEEYSCYVEVGDSHQLTVGIRSDGHYYQVRNFTISFVDDNEMETDASYLRYDYFDTSGYDAFEFDATDAEYSNAQNVVIYPQQANQVIKAHHSTQFANTTNKVVDGTCSNFVVTDGNDLQITNATGLFTATNATYSRNMNSEYEWGTVIMPYSLTSNETIQYYDLIEVKEINGTNCLCLEAVDNVAANTPVVYRKLTEGATNVTMAGINKAIALTTAAQPAVFGTLTLTGLYQADTFTENLGDYYYIAHDKFWSAAGLANGLVIPAFRSYLTMSSGVKSLNIVVLDDPTNIMVIDSQTGQTVKTANIYNLSGQLVKTNATSLDGLAPGIYVVNGKKVMVK